MTSEKPKKVPNHKKKPTYFDKVTHLYFQEKKLTSIPNLQNAQDVQTIYLYSNQLKSINDQVTNLKNLTSLYLQDNEISKIENLHNLSKLKKLYLSRNKIAVLEGLEGIEALEELHIDRQDLGENGSLCFDPRTLYSLARSLQVLIISHNRITSLGILAQMRCLIKLDASFNDLDDMKELGGILRNFYYLREAKFAGNPLCKRHRYREDVIANTYQLELLDNKIITEVSRRFIRSFEEGKMLLGTKPNVNLTKLVPALPGNYSAGVQKAASISLLKDLSLEEAEPIHISWNHFPERKPLSKPQSHSLLRGRKMESQRNIVVSKSTIKMKHSSAL